MARTYEFREGILGHLLEMRSTHRDSEPKIGKFPNFVTAVACVPLAATPAASKIAPDARSGQGHDATAVELIAPPGPSTTARSGLPDAANPGNRTGIVRSHWQEGFPPRSPRQVGPGLAHRTQYPTEGFLGVPSPRLPEDWRSFDPPKPPTCIVRPKSLHIQAERPNPDSA